MPGRVYVWVFVLLLLLTDCLLLSRFTSVLLFSVITLLLTVDRCGTDVSVRVPSSLAPEPEAALRVSCVLSFILSTVPSLVLLVVVAEDLTAEVDLVLSVSFP